MKKPWYYNGDHDRFDEHKGTYEQNEVTLHRVAAKKLLGRLVHDS
jgi:hypothetical protein